MEFKQAIEVDHGQYTLSGSFFYIYENPSTGSVVSKDQTLPPITAFL